MVQHFSIVLACIASLANMCGISGIRNFEVMRSRDPDSSSRVKTILNRLGPARIQQLKAGQLMGMSNSLPPGFAIVDGQVMDITTKVVQRRIPGGTAYFKWKDKLGRRPLYLRPGNEAGWHFVVFQDPMYWRGSGHLVVLKKMLGVNLNNSPGEHQILYEAFVVSLRIPIHPKLDRLDPYLRTNKQRRLGKLQRVKARRMKHRKPPRQIQLRNRKLQSGRRKRSAKLKNKNMGIPCCICSSYLNVTSTFKRKMLPTDTI